LPRGERPRYVEEGEKKKKGYIQVVAQVYQPERKGLIFFGERKKRGRTCVSSIPHPNRLRKKKGGGKIRVVLSEKKTRLGRCTRKGKRGEKDYPNLLKEKRRGKRKRPQ